MLVGSIGETENLLQLADLKGTVLGDLVEKVGNREFHRGVQETGLQDRAFNQTAALEESVVQSIVDLLECKRPSVIHPTG